MLLLSLLFPYHVQFSSLSVYVLCVCASVPTSPCVYCRVPLTHLAQCQQHDSVSCVAAIMPLEGEGDGEVAGSPGQYVLKKLFANFVQLAPTKLMPQLSKTLTHPSLSACSGGRTPSWTRWVGQRDSHSGQDRDQDCRLERMHQSMSCISWFLARCDTVHWRPVSLLSLLVIEVNLSHLL